MTRKQEIYTVMVFTLFSFFIAYRATERRAWNNEMKYAQGVERANMVYIHRAMRGIFR